MYYIVNGKKVDPNGNPVKDPPPNNPEQPFLAHGADLPPAPDESADEPTETAPVVDPKAPEAKTK